MSRIERITNQSELIDSINSILNMSKENNDSLGVRQYEHLKKQYVQNLFKMLLENY